MIELFNTEFHQQDRRSSKGNQLKFERGGIKREERRKRKTDPRAAKTVRRTFCPTRSGAAVPHVFFRYYVLRNFHFQGPFKKRADRMNRDGRESLRNALFYPNCDASIVPRDAVLSRGAAEAEPLRPGERFDIFARKSERGPFVERDRAERMIKVDARLIPIEASPFDAAVVPFDRDRGKVLKERFSVPASAPIGEDEQVFQIEPAAARKRGEERKEERVADRFSVFKREKRFRDALFKEPFGEQFLCGDEFVGHLFVFRDSANEFEEDCDVRFAGGAYFKFWHRCVPCVGKISYHDCNALRASRKRASSAVPP